MHVEGILKVGIAVKDMTRAVSCLTEVLGLAPGEIVTYEPYGMRYCLFTLGDSSFVELMEPTTPNGPIGRFLETHGEGLQHMSLRVSNIEEAIAELNGKGFRLVQDTPLREHVGFGIVNYAFVQPQSAHGVLLQLVQVE